MCKIRLLSDRYMRTLPTIGNRKTPFLTNNRGISMLNFNEMELKFGAVAYHYLAEIEKAAGIRSTHTNDVDPETPSPTPFGYRTPYAVKPALSWLLRPNH